jgi:hypothetical protein
MNKLTFLNFLNIERLENLYRKLMKIDLKSLDESNLNYVCGAMDALMAITGIQNTLTTFLEMDIELSKENKIAFIKEAILAANPDAIDITESLDFPEIIKEEEADILDGIETVEDLLGIITEDSSGSDE